MSVAIGKSIFKRKYQLYPYNMINQRYTKRNSWYRLEAYIIVSPEEFDNKMSIFMPDYMAGTDHNLMFDIHPWPPRTLETDKKRYDLLYYKIDVSSPEDDEEERPYWSYGYFRATRKKISRVGWKKWLIDKGTTKYE